MSRSLLLIPCAVMLVAAIAKIDAATGWLGRDRDMARQKRRRIKRACLQKIFAEGGTFLRPLRQRNQRGETPP